MAKLIEDKTPRPVTIQFTPEEVRFLKDVIGRIGGCPFNSRRKFADSINNALREADLRDYNTEDFDGSISVRNT